VGVLVLAAVIVGLCGCASQPSLPNAPGGGPSPELIAKARQAAEARFGPVAGTPHVRDTPNVWLVEFSSDAMIGGGPIVKIDKSTGRVEADGVTE